MRERDRHVAHPLDDGCPDYLNRTGNKCNRGKEGRKTTKKYSVLFLGVGVAVLLLIIPLDSLLNVTGLGPLCEKGRPTRYKHTEIITGLVY